MAAAAMPNSALRATRFNARTFINWAIGISIVLHFALGWYFVRGLMGDLRQEMEPIAVQLERPPLPLKPPVTTPPPPADPIADTLKKEPLKQRKPIRPAESSVPPSPVPPAEGPANEPATANPTPAPVAAAPTPAPAPTYRAPVEYPNRAMQREMDGVATVQITVAAGGNVSSVVVVSEKPAGYGFGDAAREAVAQWKFADAQPGTYLVTVRFKMAD